MIGRSSRQFVFLVLANVLQLRSMPQEPARSKGENPYTVQVDVAMVVLHAAVQDDKGRIISGLQKENFRVAEDGMPQEITLFQREDIPVAVGIVVDSSGSMGNKRAEVASAALAFARSGNSQDEMFVVFFNEGIWMGLPPDKPFTNNVQDLERALSRFVIQGRTALYDGMTLAIQHLGRATHQKKVLMLISDGGDNASRYSFERLLEMADKSGALIYTIGVYDEDGEDRDPGVLKRLAKVTGGQAFIPKGISEVTGTCLSIARDIRSQYTLGYFSKHGAEDSAYHKISVEASGQGKRRLQVRTRTGYYGAAVRKP